MYEAKQPSAEDKELAIELTNKGTQVQNQGRIEDGMKYYRRALEHDPCYPVAWYNLGVCYAERRMMTEARDAYLNAVKFEPKFALPHNNLGAYYKDHGDLERALHHYKLAIRANPKFSQALSNISVVYHVQGFLGDAQRSAEQAIRVDAGSPEAHNNLGSFYLEEGRAYEAVNCFERCMQLSPETGARYGADHNKLLAINFCQLDGEEDEQKEEPTDQGTDKAEKVEKLSSSPDKTREKSDSKSKNSAKQSGKKESQKDNKDKKAGSSQKGGKVEPASPEKTESTHNNHKTTNGGTENSGENKSDADSVLDNTNNLSDFKTVRTVRAARIWLEHATWGLRYYQQTAVLRFKQYLNHPDPKRQIRVGFLSSDFRTHPVSYFIEAPLRHLNREAVDVYCYLSGAPGDQRTLQLKKWVPNDRWRDLEGRDAWAVCELVRKDKIDILVEIGGHASGNRLDVMALKPAPVQVTWIGYPNTTGLPTIDYRITDRIADPEGTGQRYSEVQLRMGDPCAFLCYTQTADVPPVHPLPALAKKDKSVTFGSFNSLAKITEEVFLMWCEIMHKCPNSRILLKAKPFACSTVRGNYIKRFRAQGIDAERVTLMTHVPSRSDHLNIYGEVDLCLDSFPYAGTTTTCEALVMGVPVLTLRRVPNGRAIHSQNVGAALLSRIPTMQKFIATSRAEYIRIAVAMAHDLKQLSEVRTNLRQNFLTSPICDGALFASRLEPMFREMWGRYCADPSQAVSDDRALALQEATLAFAAEVNLKISVPLL